MMIATTLTAAAMTVATGINHVTEAEDLVIAQGHALQKGAGGHDPDQGRGIGEIDPEGQDRAIGAPEDGLGQGIANLTGRLENESATGRGTDCPG